MTRPQLLPNGIAHTEWGLRSVAGLGLDANQMMHVAVTVTIFVRGIAVNLEPEVVAEQDTGLTSDEWLAAQDREMTEILSSGPFPTFAAIDGQPGIDLDLGTLFEFGLRGLLDGFAVLIEGPVLIEGGRRAPARTGSPPPGRPAGTAPAR